MLNLKNICYNVLDIACSAGEFIRKEREGFKSESIEKKGLHDFVSYVDKGSEELIFSKLEPLIPEAGFLGEENTHTVEGKSYQWIVDPLDGTTNFIHGLFPYSVSIALMHKQEIVLGVIYEIGADEIFFSWKNAPAYCNHKIISVSKTEKLQDALISTGFPYSNFSRLKPFLNSMDFFMQNTHGLRRLGSAATDLAYLARGQFDGFYEYDLQAWDVAAGALIVKQAGGLIGDFSGGGKYIFGGEIVAANSNLFPEFLNMVNKTMCR